MQPTNDLRERLSTSGRFWRVVLAAATTLVLVGSFLPWIYREDVFSGVDGSFFGGIWVMRGLAVLVGIALLLGRFIKSLAVTAGISGVGLAGFALLLVGKENGEQEMAVSSNGPVLSGFGLWMFLIGSALLLMGGLVTSCRANDASRTERDTATVSALGD
jgi:hypothetical protein